MLILLSPTYFVSDVCMSCNEYMCTCVCVWLHWLLFCDPIHFTTQMSVDLPQRYTTSIHYSCSQFILYMVFESTNFGYCSYFFWLNSRQSDMLWDTNVWLDCHALWCCYCCGRIVWNCLFVGLPIGITILVLMWCMWCKILSKAWWICYFIPTVEHIIIYQYNILL